MKVPRLFYRCRYWLKYPLRRYRYWRYMRKLRRYALHWWSLSNKTGDQSSAPTLDYLLGRGTTDYDETCNKVKKFLEKREER